MDADTIFQTLISEIRKVSEAVIRVEGKLDTQKAEHNARIQELNTRCDLQQIELNELKEQRKWFTRTIATQAIVIALGALAYYLGIKR